MTDYTKLLAKLFPDPGGEDPLRLRTGVVSAVNTNGTADVTISGVAVPGVPVLANANALSVGEVVQMLSYRGQLLILDGTQQGGATKIQVSDAAIRSETSATYTVGPTTLGSAFVAPPSGQILVTIQGNVAQNGSVGSQAYMTGQVKDGAAVNSGTVVAAANDAQAAVTYAMIANANLYIHQNVSYLVVGLTPGATYNICHVIKTSNNQVNIQRRRVIVQPW